MCEQGWGKKKLERQKKTFAFPEKVRIQKRERSHKENLMMISSYH